MIIHGRPAASYHTDQSHTLTSNFQTPIKSAIWLQHAWNCVNSRRACPFCCSHNFKHVETIFQVLWVFWYSKLEETSMYCMIHGDKIRPRTSKLYKLELFLSLISVHIFWEILIPCSENWQVSVTFIPSSFPENLTYIPLPQSLTPACH